jgi:CRP-like cAMP-binding protein
MQARDIIATNPFFAEVLDAAELDALAKRMAARIFPPGDDLIRKDDAGSSLFVIVGGEVEVNTGDETGKHIATLGPGAIVGEMSLMTGARRSATVTAATHVRAFEVTKAALAPILAAAPALVDRFAAMLEARQAELDRAYGADAFGAGVFSKPDLAGRIRGFFRLGS